MCGTIIGMTKTLILPLKNAPTDNRRLIFAPRLKRFISSPEYRVWKEEGIWRIRAQWGFETLTPSFKYQLPYAVKVYMPSRRTDQVNWDKGARDILTEAGVWNDDKWTYCVYSPCEIDTENPRMEITIKL